VVVRPGVMIGTGQILIDGSIACVQGDAFLVRVEMCSYVTLGGHAGGFGTLTIAALNADQIAQRTTFLKKPAILRGTQFTAHFTPTIKGVTLPPASIVDPVPVYFGTGSFVTTNVRSKGQ
jgi:hypothetical protein